MSFEWCELLYVTDRILFSCLSSIVNVPAYLQKLSSCMETDISEDCDWRQIQLCVEAIRKLCVNSMYERRAVSGKEHGGISILLRVLETTSNSNIILVILDILSVLSEHKHKVRGWCDSLQSLLHSVKLVEADCVGALFASFARQKGRKFGDDTRIHHLKLLLQLAPKDKKFSTKARLHGTLPCVHVLLQDLQHNHQEAGDIIVAINTVRTLSSSSVNVSSFHCIGTPNMLLKRMQSSKRKDLHVLRCTADAVAALLKQKGSYAKVAQKTVVCVLPLIEDLYALDRLQRHNSVQLSLLTCLRTAVMHSCSCRQVFREKGGQSKLYALAKFWNESKTKEMVELATVSCRILQLCLPEVTIKLSGLTHPLTFPLPDCGDLHLVDGEVTASDDDDVEGGVVSTADDDSQDATEQEIQHSDSSNGSQSCIPGYTPDYQSFTKLVSSVQEVASSPPSSQEPLQTVPVIPKITQDGTDMTLSVNSGEPLLQPRNTELLHYNHDIVPSSRLGLLEYRENTTTSSHVQVEIGWADRKRVSSDTSLSQKLSSCDVLESSSSTDQLSSQKMRPDEYDRFFPELFPGCSNVSQNEKEDEEGLTVESVSSPELLIHGEIDSKSSGSKTSLSQAESTCLHQGIHSVDTFTDVPPFVKYKDRVPDNPELQYKKPSGLDRKLILHNVWRHLSEDILINRVVYDLDEALKETSVPEDDEEQIKPCQGLQFDGRFESGNLRRVVHVCENEYDMLLNSDINSDHHHQWFCFKVMGMEPGVPYVFNIVNFEKKGSQFNAGMQPVVFSVKEAEQTEQGGWYRSGEDVAYYTNQFRFMDSTTGEFVKKSCRTATFTLTFPHSDDVCYVAYHYPYLYTDLMGDLYDFEKSLNRLKVFYNRKVLCTTLNGNSCPIITITAVGETTEDFRGRDYIMLTARVHPGETNASWVMRGVLKLLVSDDPVAERLRQKFIFKIIPMLNPDGVINGSHRCSLSGCDLNRRWASPDSTLHPTIYNAKCVLQWLVYRQRSPLVYCDFHGHSQIKNFVLYGCPDPSGGTVTENLAKILSSMAPAFCIRGCKYKWEKSKEGAARVVVWRMGVVRSYTMESSYCGAGTGRYKGMQFNTSHLEEMGINFCCGLLSLDGKEQEVDEKEEGSLGDAISEQNQDNTAPMQYSLTD